MSGARGLALARCETGAHLDADCPHRLGLDIAQQIGSCGPVRNIAKETVARFVCSLRGPERGERLCPDDGVVRIESA